MKSLAIRLNAILILGTTVLCFTATAASAQPVMSVANLTLKKVYMKTVSDSSMSLDQTPRSIFAPATVTCPSGGSCTIRAQVSAQGQGFEEGAGINAAAYVDGIQMHPYEAIPLLSEFVRSNTYAWMLPDLPAGAHTVEIRLYATAGSPAVNNRILTIDVLKP